MPVLSLSFASTSAKRPPLGVVDHYGSRKGVHPFTGSLTTFNVTGCLVYLFGEAMIMDVALPLLLSSYEIYKVVHLPLSLLPRKDILGIW